MRGGDCNGSDKGRDQMSVGVEEADVGLEELWCGGVSELAQERMGGMRTSSH